MPDRSNARNIDYSSRRKLGLLEVRIRYPGKVPRSGQIHSELLLKRLQRELGGGHRLFNADAGVVH